MKQKIIWQIYLFSKGNYFLEINSVLNFSLSALQGLVYKKALKKKKRKRDKHMQPHHSQSWGTQFQLNWLAHWSVAARFTCDLSHKVFMHLLWTMHSILRSFENLNNY